MAQTFIPVKACVLFVGFLCGVLSAQAQGTFVYDQQSALETGFQEGGMGIQSNQPIGQSFAPTNSSIGFIRLYLYNTGLAVGSAYVNIRENSITGNLLGLTDAILIPSAFAGFTDLFFSSPLALSPGSTYYFQPVASINTLGINKGFYNYAGGAAFYQGVANPAEDLWFREGIVVPEPGTWTLLLVGVATVAWRRRLFR